jgi:RsiW-degrading membrane proteinase PrsW (M82 family)
MELLMLSLAPIFIIGFYIYFRDKWEKEPIKLLLLALLFGGLTVIPILLVDSFIVEPFGENLVDLPKAAFDAFLVAALVEELFKFLALYLLIWKSSEFNENFDGIVYAVFISLGFALVENILYIFSSNDGASVGILRSVTAVPAHALFGVAMGYHFALAKFEPTKRTYEIFLALLVPILLHGFYDFWLMSQNGFFLLLFIPYVIGLWVFGFKRMKTHSETSVFKK